VSEELQRLDQNGEFTVANSAEPTGDEPTTLFDDFRQRQAAPRDQIQLVLAATRQKKSGSGVGQEVGVGRGRWQAAGGRAAAALREQISRSWGKVRNGWVSALAA
jgi:hypothetical protein